MGQIQSPKLWCSQGRGGWGNQCVPCSCWQLENPSHPLSHGHAPLPLHTFRSGSSSSIFGAPCDLAFSWGSSDSASLSELGSVASVLGAVGEGRTGQSLSHHHLGSASSWLGTVPATKPVWATVGKEVEPTRGSEIEKERWSLLCVVVVGILREG